MGEAWSFTPSQTNQDLTHTYFFFRVHPAMLTILIPEEDNRWRYGPGRKSEFTVTSTIENLIKEEEKLEKYTLSSIIILLILKIIDHGTG